MSPRAMYVGRRPRRRGLGFIGVVLSGLLIVIVGAVGFGVYSALTMLGVVPAASILPAPPPTPTATPTATPAAAPPRTVRESIRTP